MIKKTLLAVFITALMSGCGILKNGTKEPDKVPSGTPTRQTLTYGVPATFNVLTFNANIGFVSNGTENDFTATFRIRKDSLIWISIRKFGLEGARMMLSQDSVWLMDRINSQYFSGDYLFFLKQFNLDVDYDLVESFLLANPLSNWSEEAVEEGCDDEVCRVAYPGRYRVNQGRDERARPEGSTVTDQRVEIAKETGRLLSNSIEIRGEGRKVSAAYQGWKSLQHQLFPVRTELTVDNQGVPTVIKINAEALKMDEPGSYPFKIPGTYKPMKIK